MPLTKEQKKKIIEELKEKIDKQKIVIFADFTGIKVKDLTDLRKKLKKTDSELRIAKKTLFKIAFEKEGLEIDIKKLQGEIALVFGYKEQIQPAKIVYQFASANPNLKILGGYLENKFVAAEKIIELAQLPTKEELLAKLVGSIFSSISGLINVLQAPLEACVFVINAFRESKINE